MTVALAIIKLNFDVYHGDHIKQLKNGERNKQEEYVSKRERSELMEIENSKTWYLTELQIGQKKAKVRVLISTGSSDLWIHATNVFCKKKSTSSFSFEKRNSEIGNAKDIDNQNKVISQSYSSELTSITGRATSANTCTNHGSFNTADSDSYHSNDTAKPFEIGGSNYVNVWGTWGYDSVFFGDVEVNDLSFAVVDVTDSEMGVLGIGLPGVERTYNYAFELGYQYENFPMKLKSQGLIGKNVYSLYLDKMTANSGTVLFGAVDHAKYEGQLHTVPMTKDYTHDLKSSSVVRTQVILSGINFLSNHQTIKISESIKYNAILDSGWTFSYFPTQLFDKFIKTLGLGQSTYDNSYIIPCTNDANIKIEFDFNGATIEVPLIDLMVPTKDGKCILGVLKARTLVLGNNILRNGYFVFDLDGKEISMAQVKYTKDEDIEVVSSTIPSAVRIEKYSSTNLNLDYQTTTDTNIATYATGAYPGDGQFYSAFWGLTSRTAGMKSFGDKSSVGFITSLVSLVLSIVFL